MSGPKNAKDYGEPWRMVIEADEDVLRVFSGPSEDTTLVSVETWMPASDRRWLRIIACVNALRGVAEPESFVRAADALMRAFVQVKECLEGKEDWNAAFEAIEAYRAARDTKP